MRGRLRPRLGVLSVIAIFQQLSAGIIVLLRHLAIIINEAEGGRRKCPLGPSLVNPEGALGFV